MKFMYVVATYEFSDGLETAVAELENFGVNKKDILVLPLDKRAENTKIFDSLYNSDGKSLIDFAAILGTVFMLLGGIYGFVLTWGPIIWALIGLISGSLIGFIIDFSYTMKKQKSYLKITNLAEVIIMVKCEEYQVDKIKKMFWDQFALGMTTFTK